MPKWDIWINQGGLMEDPEFHWECHAADIVADDEEGAYVAARAKDISDGKGDLFTRHAFGHWSYWGWETKCVPANAFRVVSKLFPRR